MSIFPISVGTVSVSAGDTDLTGTNTNFDVAAVEGSTILVAGQWGYINAVASDTAATLLLPFTGASQVDQPYVILRLFGPDKSLLHDDITQLIAIFNKFNVDAFGGVDAFGADLAGRAAHDGEDAGFTYAYVDDGVPTYFTRLASGGWTDAYSMSGLKGDMGLSAYQVALNNGYVGSEAAWLATLNGVDGTNGWVPQFATVADGARRVHQIADWTGGTSAKPATGLYVGATGLVSAIADGVDIRGAAGDMSGSNNLSELTDIPAALDALGLGNVLKSSAINLLQDSGTFSDKAPSAQTGGAYQFPAYLTLYNGAADQDGGKFTHDNSTFGGSGAALNTDLEDLMNMLKTDNGAKQWGNEFYATLIIAGTGTSASSFDINGIDGNVSVYTSFRPTPSNFTFFGHYRCKTGGILFRKPTGNQMTYFKNGLKQPGSVVILPSDGWVTIQAQYTADDATYIGYQPSPLLIYAQPNSQYLMAGIAMVYGLTDIDYHTTLVPSFGTWPAV